MTPREQHAKTLENLKCLWEAGMLPALFQAIRYSSEGQLALPEWAAVGAMNFIQDAFHGRTMRGSSGAKNSVKGRFQMDFAHYRRWLWMDFEMSLKDSPRPAGSGRRRRNETTMIELARRVRPRLRSRIEKQGGLQQIIDSYRVVEKSRKRGELRFAFERLYYPLE